MINQPLYETGRGTIIQKSTTILLVLLVLASLRISRTGMEAVPSQIFRLAIWGVLNLWLYQKGSSIAKWLIIVYTAWVGMICLTFVDFNLNYWTVILAVYSYFYLSYAYELLFSPAVKYYLGVRNRSLSEA